MMRKMICWPILLLFFPNMVAANDAMTISKQIGREAQAYFYARDFKALNALETEYRIKQSRLPDGRWKLTFLFSYIGVVSKRGAESEWKRQLELCDEWISQTPEQPAPYLAKASVLTGYAWDARGGGYASTVSDAQWKLFHERIAESRNVLESSKEIMKNNPTWYLEMIIIAKAQGWPEKKFDKLFNDAVEAAPNYYYIYFRAADYYQPRWHGSQEKLRAFVDNAVAHSKAQEGMTLYTRIYWSQLWALKEDTFAPGNAEWKKMHQGFEDIMRQYPDSSWNLNAYGFYACMANDWTTAQKVLEQIGEKPLLPIWTSFSKFDDCRQRASGLTKTD